MCYSYILRVYECVFSSCLIPLLFAYMCMRMAQASSPMSIAVVPSGRALPGYPITAHHMYVFLVYLQDWWCVGIINQNPKSKNQKFLMSWKVNCFTHLQGTCMVGPQLGWFKSSSLLLCLFAGIKSEKIYSASCVGREVNLLRVITHGQTRSHKPPVHYSFFGPTWLTGCSPLAYPSDWRVFATQERKKERADGVAAHPKTKIEH